MKGKIEIFLREGYKPDLTLQLQALTIKLIRL
jgi:hypothetical protein